MVSITGGQILIQPVSFSDLLEDPKEEDDDDMLRGKMRWEDMKRAATVLPHLEDEARYLIMNYLGYVPAQHIILPHEPFIRSIIHGVRQGTVSRDNAWDVVEMIKQIRNEDMKDNLCTDYSMGVYENYRAGFIPYGQMARERLVGFMDYEPELQHSVFAEVWLRDVMSRDNMQLGEQITEIDFRAITLIHYREILLSEGKAAADDSMPTRMVYLRQES